MPASHLSVFLRGEHVGELSRVREKTTFQYDEKVVSKHPGAPLLSTALPVQARPFDAAATRNWFCGLLPESTRLDEVRRFYGITGSDYFDVLEEIGWECAGAVSVASRYREMQNGATGGMLSLSACDLTERLAALPAHPYDSALTMRMSLGGFQEKLCVCAPDARMNEGRMMLGTASIPLNGAPTTHILKPQPHQFPGMIQAEAWGMAAAASATFAAETGLLESAEPEMPETLAVTRFDRVVANGEISRIHQEDCCQALGLGPLQKYAAESSPKKSDPSFKRIAALLSMYALDVPHELETLLRHMTVNVALGNTDAHAKNYAFLHEGEGISLAPLYDVVPAMEITPGIVAMGIRIDGRIRIDRIERENIIAEAKGWGVVSRRANVVADETLERLREGIEHASVLYPEAGERHFAPALKRIAQLAQG